jgi:hypothetical protein
MADQSDPYKKQLELALRTLGSIELLLDAHADEQCDDPKAPCYLADLVALNAALDAEASKLERRLGPED